MQQNTSASVQLLYKGSSNGTDSPKDIWEN